MADVQNQIQIPEATAFAISVLMDQAAAAEAQASSYREAAQELVKEYCFAKSGEDLDSEITYEQSTRIATY